MHAVYVLIFCSIICYVKYIYSSQFCRLCDLVLYNKQVVNKANAIISVLPHILYLMCSHLLARLATAEATGSNKFFTSAALGLGMCWQMEKEGCDRLSVMTTCQQLAFVSFNGDDSCLEK